jgi:NAD+ synthase
MNTQKVIEHITRWLGDYAERSRVSGFVVGISGGIDSALTSALCARTGKPTLALTMPIYQAASQVNRGKEHIEWLKKNHANVTSAEVELTATFDALMRALPEAADVERRNLALANTRARLRMTTLYYFAGLQGLLVAGTGNKVEDFGVGFYTKYGDGGVDLSPIADLTKSEVYELSRALGIVPSILSAAPTDGLWGDDRTDEDQIGASYPELEWAMEYAERAIPRKGTGYEVPEKKLPDLTDRQNLVLQIFIRMHNANRHKMDPIPVCLIPGEWKR